MNIVIKIKILIKNFKDSFYNKSSISSIIIPEHTTTFHVFPWQPINSKITINDLSNPRQFP